jgi:hypothetical protein
VAAHASAAPSPTLFRLTVSGTVDQKWTYTPAPTGTGGCRQTVTSKGIRTTRFGTSAPVVVRLVGGRVLPATVRGIAGTVTLGGADTTDEICGSTHNSQVTDCAQTKRTFSGASAHVVSPRPGVLTVNRIDNVRLTPAACPREPPDVRSHPLGPSPDLVRLPKAALTERRIVGMSLRASRNQHKVYGSPEQGRLETIAEWTLTFTRLGS